MVTKSKYCSGVVTTNKKFEQRNIDGLGTCQLRILKMVLLCNANDFLKQTPDWIGLM
mgnify:CR=1 FL=1